MTIELLAIGYVLLKQQLWAEPGKLTSYWRTDKRKCVWILQRLCHKKHWTSLRWWSMMMNGNYIHKSLAAVHISIVLCLSNQEGNPAKLLYTSVKAFVCPNILLSKVFSWFHECGMVRQAMARTDSPILVLSYQPSLNFASNLVHCLQVVAWFMVSWHCTFGAVGRGIAKSFQWTGTIQERHLQRTHDGFYQKGVTGRSHQIAWGLYISTQKTCRVEHWDLENHRD